MATRFWVGGTGTWDASDTTHWAATSGTAGGQSVPGAADDVTFDGSSGGGTVTVNTTVAVLSLTCGAFTGTLDFSANNNSVTLSSNTGFVGSGTGVRTINLGNGTWTLSGQGTVWNLATTTNLTFAANSSTLSFTNASASGAAVMSGGGKTYNAVSIAAPGSGFGKQFTIAGANTYASLTVGAGIRLILTVGITQTVTTFSFAGTQAKPGVIESTTPGSSAATLSVASGTVTLDWITMVAGITFSGGATFTATNTFNFNSTGLTAAVPSFGGGIISG